MGLLTKLPVLLGGAMLIEAVVLVGAMKMLGGGAAPASAAAGAEIHGEEGAAAEGGHGEAASHGEGGEGAAKGPKKELAEVPIVEFRAPNKKNGKTFLYDVVIVASVKAANEEAVKNAIEQRKGLIADKVRTIIAMSDPEKLNGSAEPGLETLRRQVKFELDSMIDPKAKGLIEEVLVPRCLPFRADF
ncbi:MAG: hypothetical protein QM770_22615 [Tepidisphaeraceae bacterium]